MLPIRFLLALSCIIGNTIIHAQTPGNPRHDSLIVQVNKQICDSNQVKALNALGKDFLNVGMLDTAQLLFLQGEDLAAEINFSGTDLKLQQNLGISYFYQGNNEEATRHWEVAKAIAIRKNDTKTLPSIDLFLADVQQAKGNLADALKLFYQALKGFEVNLDSQSISGALSNIGVIQSQMENPDQAEEFIKKSTVIADKLGFEFLRCNNRYLLSDVYTKRKKFDVAEKLVIEGLHIAEQAQDIHMIAQGHLTLATTYSGQDKVKEAIEEDQQANIYLRKMGALDILAANQGRLATLYLELAKPEQKASLEKFFNGQLDKAIGAAKVLADSSMMFLKQSGDLYNQKNLYETLAQIDELESDYKGAFENYVQFKTLSDTLLNIERDKKITQTSMQYEFDKKDAATKAIQEKKDIRQATIRNSIVGVLGGSLFFLGLVYRQRNRISTEKKRSDNLLLNILPAEVAEELKIKGSTDARQFDNTTVLFTDFVRFTEIAERLTPKELVAEIHTCFKAFDDIIQRHGLEKIKTIGDSYMAACGVPQDHPDHARLTVLAALDIRDFVNDYVHQRVEQNKPAFEVRIGLHSGPVVAGIVGVKKFQYDIWGDTVNTASRMESSGEAGKVQISQFTYELVKDVSGLSFTNRGKQVVKGKGEMETYFVERVGL